MNKQDKIIRYGFAAFSLITSFCFVFYAVSILFGSDADFNLKMFAYVAGGYGLLNTYVLNWAWRAHSDWPAMANMCIAVCFFGVLLMDILRDGFQGEMQVAVLLGLAAVLTVNWYAIRLLGRIQ